jgi:HlyD family secretion protein
MKALFIGLVLIGLAAGGTVYYKTHFATDPPANFRTVAVKRGDLLSTISATGTLEPEEVVDIGAQVAGIIQRLGADLIADPTGHKSIDWGSEVKEGTELAYIDQALFKAAVDQAQATLDYNEANLLQLQAHLDQAEQEWKRAEALRATKAIADSDYDVDVANYKAGKANVAVGVAAIKQAKASLDQAKINLAYTVIKSPVKGVIVDRRVNVGQTVVSSLSAPSLFLVAQDLRRMQVWASVNEADIGRITPGLPATFTVDAYPGQVFQGKVDSVRLNATMTQNVVTYTVVVTTDNSDRRLLPYLTTNLNFEIERRHSVLIVPNAALRWKPRVPQLAPDLRQAALDSAAQAKSGKGGGPDQSSARSSATDQSPEKSSAAAPPGKSSGHPHNGKSRKEHGEHNRVWVKDGDFVRPIDVQVGATDGVSTEISGEVVKDEMEVVIGEIHKDSGEADTTNPFAPKLFKGK